MAYAIPIIVTAAFLAAYTLISLRVSPKYYKTLDFEEFKRETIAFVRAGENRQKGGKDRSSDFKLKIRLGVFVLSKNSLFEGFKKAFKDMREATKLNASVANLTFVGGEARAKKLMELAINHNGFVFDESRIAFALEEQNRFSTLTYDEIMGMRRALFCAMLEKLAGVVVELKIVAHARKLARLFVRHRRLFSFLKVYLKYPLFFRSCAIEAGFDFERDKLDGVLRRIRHEAECALDAIEKAGEFDFSRFYTPLEILSTYDAFECASDVEKQNFLAALKKMSDKENLDEFVFAIKLDKFCKTAMSAHRKVVSLDFSRYSFRVVAQKADVSMLAVALSSSENMRLLFSKPIPKGSIPKNEKFKNSFEPIYHFHTLNFGISVKDGLLKVEPRLPSDINSAEVVFSYGGINHTLMIKRGEQREISVNGTRLHGTNEVRLSDKPLYIELSLEPAQV